MNLLKLSMVPLFAVSLAACSATGGSAQNTGTFIGAIGGAAAGAALGGRGSGRVVGAALGAGAGALVGNQIGKGIDDQKRSKDHHHAHGPYHEHNRDYHY